MSKHDGMEEIQLKSEQISFDDGQIVDSVAKTDIPIETAVVTDAPDQVVIEEVTAPAPVEVVSIEEEVVEQPMAVVEEPVYSQVEPVVAEAVEPVKHAIWPWALGALALAGLGTALAWPHPAPVEVVAQPAPVAPNHVAAPVAPTPTVHKATTPIPTCDGQLIVKEATDIFTSASETSTVVTSLPKQTAVTITAPGENGWFPVTSGTAHGYVPVTSIGCGVTAEVTVTG